MNFKTVTLALLSLLFSPTFSLTINIVEDEVTFNHSGDPVEINLMLLDKGKIIKWSTQKAIKISSLIRVVNSHGNSLGYREQSNLTFIPMGVSNDKKFYKLVGVINRNVISQKRIEATVKILGKNVSSDTFTIVIPELSSNQNKIASNNIDYLTKEAFDSQIYTFYVAFLLTILGTILGLYVSQKKTNTVAEAQGSKLSSKINSTFEKSTEKHHKLMNTTRKIKTDTKELRKLSDRIDFNIQNISKNPEKYKKELKNNLSKYTMLLEVTKSDIDARDKSLLEFKNLILQVVYSNSEKIDNLSALIDSTHHQVSGNEQYIIEIYNIISNLVPVNNESIREIIKDEFTDLVR